VFDPYEADVRAEYAFVPDEPFRAGRLRLLKSFAERETIYSTEAGQKRSDEQARANLARSMAQLSM
jgi:predicted metal-dependent HD superfamily phosphohydrolase